MTTLTFDLTNLNTLFKEIGLFSSNDRPYKAQTRKHQQILAYLPLLESASKKLSTKRPIVFLDCGCGKSYLSFAVYAYFTHVLGRDIKIIGIDRNPELINKCNESANTLGFKHLNFYCADVAEFTPNESIDMVYSLHACDAATDYTIAAGINFGAQYVFSVSCCQHTNHNNIRSHALTSISRHAPYKERLTDMIGDSMRALILEHYGYGVNVFEFINSQYTPKNIVLRAIKNKAKKTSRANALAQYQELTKMFSFEPALMGLL